MRNFSQVLCIIYTKQSLNKTKKFKSNSENLQMAAENLRLKSEKRRSDMALKVSQEKNFKKKFDEEIMQLDELGKISPFILIPNFLLSENFFRS